MNFLFAEMCITKYCKHLVVAWICNTHTRLDCYVNERKSTAQRAVQVTSTYALDLRDCSIHAVICELPGVTDHDDGLESDNQRSRYGCFIDSNHEFDINDLVSGKFDLP